MISYVLQRYWFLFDIISCFLLVVYKFSKHVFFDFFLFGRLKQSHLLETIKDGAGFHSTLLKNRIIGLIYVFVVFTAYFINFQTILPVSNMVLFFFSIGCYFGLHAISQVDIKKSYLLCSFLFFTLTLLLAYVFSSEYHDLFKRIYIISSFLFIYSASYLLNKAIKLPEFLFDSNCSFFIYAIHMFFYTFVFYITTDCMKLAHGSRTLATPSVIILSIATYYLLLRIAPKFLSVLLGGRLIRKAQ